MRRWWLVCYVVAACAEPEPEAPVTPVVEGAWNLRFTPMDTTCYPNLVAPSDLYDFLTETSAGLYVARVDVEQDDGRLAASMPASGCALDGSVGVGGVFSLTGRCDSDTLGRALRLTGVASGESTIEIDGNLHLDVDLDGDAEFDCTSDPVEVSGTGTPPL